MTVNHTMLATMLASLSWQGFYNSLGLLTLSCDVVKGKGLQKGVKIAAIMIKTLGDERLCHGIHIITMGNERVAPDLLETTE